MILRFLTVLLSYYRNIKVRQTLSNFNGTYLAIFRRFGLLFGPNAVKHEAELFFDFSSGNFDLFRVHRLCVFAVNLLC